jgi:hypothetical protein
MEFYLIFVAVFAALRLGSIVTKVTADGGPLDNLGSQMIRYADEQEAKASKKIKPYSYAHLQGK